jgi:hypothetical protein
MGVLAFVSAADWHASNVGAVFPTRSSVDWFVKQHRRELVEQGVLIPGRGRAGSVVHAELFGPVALAIVRRERGGLENREASAA